MLLVTLTEADRDLIEREIIKPMWSDKKTGNYGSGIIKDKTDIKRVAGYGEFAFNTLFQPDIIFNKEYMVGGDKNCDATLNDVCVNVKTSRSSKVGALLVTRQDHGREYKIRADIYVWAYLTVERDIMIAGFATAEMIRDAPLTLGRNFNASHYNAEIPVDQLKDPELLFDIFKVKRSVPRFKFRDFISPLCQR